jgi:site-specific recombinase XerD
MRLFRRGEFWYIGFKRGVERSLRTKDKKEAKRLFKLAKAEYLKGRLVKLDASERVTLAEFFELYLQSRYNVRPLTLKKDRIALSAFIDSVGGGIALKLIRDTHFDKFKTDSIGRGIKPTSVNSYLRHLRTAFNWAFERKLIDKKVSVELLKRPKRLPRTLDPEEIKAIREHAMEHDPEIYRMIEFALWTGCRREEVRNLTWQNVHPNHVRIIGKGDKERIVPLLQGAKDAMGEPKDIGPVFLQIHIDTISHRFKDVARACGLEDVTFHTLRHSAATRMVEVGIRLEVIQEILGHADMSTTRIYAQIYNQVVMTEMEKLTY